MHESVHLSNNAVQCKYKNAKRNAELPDENMWDCYTFKAYLRYAYQAKFSYYIIYIKAFQDFGLFLSMQV